MYEFLTGQALYNFVKGPLVWASFIIFTGGSLWRIFSLIAEMKRDKAVYPYMSLKYSLRSILHWIVPFASTNMRKRPWITVITFAFHLCLITTPVFLLAHNKLWYEAWNIQFRAIPESIADATTLIVIVCALFFLIRKLTAPYVRFVTLSSDYILLGIAAAPFITGFMSYHQLFFDYKIMVILHILFGEIMLIAIPFTRLNHMLFFWFTRAYTGSDFGNVRHSRDY